MWLALTRRSYPSSAPAAGGVAARLQHLVHRLGGEHARPHGVVDPLQLGDVHEPGRVARQDRAGNRDAVRHREETALRDRLRTPGLALAAGEELADHGMGLELLEEVVHREGRVMVLEPDDQADGQPVLAHRVDEAAAGLTVLARPAKRPAERVDHAVERARDLPHLLHAEAPDLRVHGAEAELLGERPCQMPLCPLAQHRGPGPDLDPRLVRGGRLPIAVEALVAGHDAADGAAVDEQRLGGRLGQHHRSELLGLLAQVAAELRQREDPVALVVEGRRRRQANAVARAHEVDGLAPDGAEARQLVERRLRAGGRAAQRG